MRIAKCKMCNVWWTSINRRIEERLRHNEQFDWVSLGLGIPLAGADSGYVADEGRDGLEDLRPTFRYQSLPRYVRSKEYAYW